MAEVGSAFVSILPSAKGFGRSLDRQVSGEVSGSGKKAGTKFGAAFKIGAIAAAIGAGSVLHEIGAPSTHTSDEVST